MYLLSAGLRDVFSNDLCKRGIFPNLYKAGRLMIRPDTITRITTVKSKGIFPLDFLKMFCRTI